MPRQRSESKHARRPTSKRSKSPAPACTQSRAPQKWKNESQELGSIIVDSVVEGVVNVVVPKVVKVITDTIISPRVIKHETVASNITTSDSRVKKTVASNTPTFDPCVEKSKAYEDWIGASGRDTDECEFYMNMLTECRKAAKSSYLAS